MGGKYRDKVIMKKRAIFMFFSLTCILIILAFRVSYLMIGESTKLKGKAIDQWTSEVKIAPKRGKILDRNGHELAISANVYRLDVDLNALRDDLRKDSKKGSKKESKTNSNKNKITMEEIAAKLSKLLEMDETVLRKKLMDPLPNGKPKGGAMIKRRIERDSMNAIKDFLKQEKIYGFIISPDTKRYYPNNNFLAHVLGSTNADGEGLMGIEKVYDKYLAGIPGIKIAELDKNREDMPYVISDYIKPVDGKNVVLTIDENIQFFCEKAADQALKDNKAKTVSIMVMDPNNGEVLAMVNKPDFNPNTPYDNSKKLEENQKIWRNRVVSDTFEPGSIFKVVTATAAMKEGKVSKDDTFVCNGSRVVQKKTLHCAKRTGHGIQNFADILKNSCNVGFMELGRRLGPDLLIKYTRMFGFGSKTGIDLNGEASGIVMQPKKITELDLATISFGQTNTVSCMQYLTGFNVIANGGKLITPHLMKEVTHYDDDNNMIADIKFGGTEKNVLDENTMRELRGYLEKVVSEGGGKKAYIQGYHIGGKTGTAQKIRESGKGYAEQKYIASFAGMAPADKPVVTLLISIDEPDPSNYYGGQISAPVAKQVFNDIFNYLPFKSDGNDEDRAKSLLKDVVIPEIRGKEKGEGLKILKENKLKYKLVGEGKYISDINPKPGCSVKEGTEILVYTSNSNKSVDNIVVIPDLRGCSTEAAKKILGDLGLQPYFVGDGMVASQSVQEGTRVNKGASVTLHLEIIGD